MFRLLFDRYFSHHRARWWEKYLSKRSVIKHTCSWRDKLIALWTLNRQAKIFLRIYIIFLRVKYIISFFSSLSVGWSYLFGGEIWRFQIRRWRNLAEALGMILNITSLIRIPQVCLRHLADERNLGESVHTDIHTRTHTHILIANNKTLIVTLLTRDK